MTTSAVDFATPLATIEQAKTWIEALHAAEMIFHFEDSADTIINGLTGEPLFTDEQAEQVQERVAELYSFEWGTDECPIGYALNLMDPNWRSN